MDLRKFRQSTGITQEVMPSSDLQVLVKYMSGGYQQMVNLYNTFDDDDNLYEGTDILWGRLSTIKKLKEFGVSDEFIRWFLKHFRENDMWENEDTPKIKFLEMIGKILTDTSLSQQQKKIKIASFETYSQPQPLPQSKKYKDILDVERTKQILEKSISPPPKPKTQQQLQQQQLEKLQRMKELQQYYGVKVPPTMDLTQLKKMARTCRRLEKLSKTIPNNTLSIKTMLELSLKDYPDDTIVYLATNFTDQNTRLQILGERGGSGGGGAQETKQQRGGIVSGPYGIRINRGFKRGKGY